MKEFLLNLLSGALETAGESKLKEVLQQLHDKNPDLYDAAIHGGWALCKSLETLVDSSKTKIDDAILGALENALKESAEKNGVIL